MVFAFKLALILLIVFIIFNLIKALIFMVKEPPSDAKDRPSMSHFLGRRVMFSALVIILLIIALLTGWIEPNPTPY
ncbi:DUF2909 domain-containing protein [Vibrio sp. SCSIO 43137]|uniref:DUF2909 domain-containing protein n=1 Tax=Vibrio sp. SCSIO 43137 TaxID=3021011 RepID=UPI002307855B|nr:DUF2909 domain-containing protein [Vibrio sp. SCSIO 43137]WCE29365.1 DUF2909 domain-containing protein [Vibrio sp. SCSIO 43137]